MGQRAVIVFDLDGTLADTSGDLIAAANAVLARRGLGGLDTRADAPIAFRGGRAMLQAGYDRSGQIIPPGALDEDFPALLDAYGAALDRHTTLYPGAAEAMRDLRAQGYAVAICTNKPEGLAATLIERLGLSPHCDALVGADTLPVRKPDPAPYREAVARAGGTVARSFLVGDTETDLKTARNCAVRIALVGFGPEGADIARLGPDAMLAHFDDLPELARRWLGAA